MTYEEGKIPSPNRLVDETGATGEGKGKVEVAMHDELSGKEGVRGHREALRKWASHVTSAMANHSKGPEGSLSNALPRTGTYTRVGLNLKDRPLLPYLRLAS